MKKVFSFLEYSKLMNTLDIIEQRGVFQILSLLIKQEAMYYSEIKEKLNVGQHALYSSFTKLMFYYIILMNILLQ